MHGFDVGMGGALFQAEVRMSETAQKMVGCLGAEMVLNQTKRPTPSIVGVKQKKMLEFICSLLSLGLRIEK